jgi:Fibronectin type III domain
MGLFFKFFSSIFIFIAAVVMPANAFAATDATSYPVPSNPFGVGFAPDGTMYIATSNWPSYSSANIYRAKPDGTFGLFMSNLPGGAPVQVRATSDGHVWVGFPSQVLEFSGEGSQIATYRPCDGINGCAFNGFSARGNHASVLLTWPDNDGTSAKIVTLNNFSSSVVASFTSVPVAISNSNLLVEGANGVYYTSASFPTSQDWSYWQSSITKLMPSGEVVSVNTAQPLYWSQGMTIDPQGNLIISQTRHDIVELNPVSGEIVNSFGRLGNNEGVAVSPLNGSVWAAYFGGGVYRIGEVPVISVPDPPSVSSSIGTNSGELVWSWSAQGDGGSTVTSYTWTGACSGSGNVTTVTCSGLTGGTNYTLNVTATNAVGTSSAGSSSLLATSIPAAPTVNTPSSPASGQLTWTWSPNATGGSAITSYSWSGACSGSGNVTTVTCSGLTGGTNYILNVTATNAVGVSSAGSSSLVATSIPAAPTVNTPSSPASGLLTWTWSPNATGGSSITSYSWSGACSGSGNVTTVTCSGLTGGANYTLRVTATNGVGTSIAGSRSGTALTIPSPPIANSSPANGALNVTWTAPSSAGGTPITGYTATATSSGLLYSCTSTTLSCAITGLTNATTYSVSVVATNAKGNSTPSNTVSIYPAPDTKFLAYSPNSVVLVKSNFQVLVANAKAGAVVTVTAAGATKTCTANAVGECSVTLNSAKSAGWVIVASYVDGKKTVSTATSYRVNIANITVSSVQVAKGKSFTVKISSGAPNTKFQVATSDGTSYSVNLTSAGAGTITVVTKAKGTLTLTISDNGTLLQTTTVAVV